MFAFAGLPGWYPSPRTGRAPSILDRYPVAGHSATGNMRRSRMRRAGRSWPPRAGGSSPHQTRPAAGSSAICTTVPSSGWSLALAARTAEADVAAGRGDPRAYLARIAAGLADAVAELQELSRGIDPAALSEHGLGPALRTLARRSAVPVDLAITTNARCPEPIEVAAYYVASEALANRMKHAQASLVEISLTTRHGSLLLSIRDDGVGGANPARGSGLAGLTDRVRGPGRLDPPPQRCRGRDAHHAHLPLEDELAQGPG